MSRTLCLDGLPSWMTSSQLHLLCLMHGQTMSAQVITDSEGRSLQFGIVKMASEEDARELIVALDGTDQLDGTDRTIYVAKMPEPYRTSPHRILVASHHSEQYPQAELVADPH